MNQNDDPAEAKIIRFPQSRVLPASASRPFRKLGFGKMAEAAGLPLDQTTGHWCSSCKGIWFGCLAEVACPACGNRHG